MSKDPAILQYEGWQKIINSRDWKYFRGMVKEHIEYLDKQTCISVREKKFDEAMKYQARSDDWKTVFDKVDRRIKELGDSIEAEKE